MNTRNVSNTIPLPTLRTRAQSSPALLTMAGYTGTLAAARCLAENGVSVGLTAERVLEPALWSRSVTLRLRAPDMRLPASALAFLLEFGRRRPGYVLHPTSDDVAWLIATRQEQLTGLYRTYAPSPSAVRTVLDKSRLYRASRDVGLATPDTWLPRSAEEAAELGTRHPTLVVKPRSQVFFPGRAKGGVAQGAEVGHLWRRLSRASWPGEVRADMPDIELPMVQEYVPTTGGVCSISGFVGQDGQVSAARGAVKVLQRPLDVGVGLCFAASAARPELVARIGALARQVGYRGVFEAEFVERDGRFLLIDFNPRYYGQMGFDIARGAPLPAMLHAAALGDEPARDAFAREPANAPRMYCDRVSLHWMLYTYRRAPAFGPEQRRLWRERLRTELKDAVDARFAPRDALPGFAAMANTLTAPLRHPRGFLRSLGVLTAT